MQYWFSEVHLSCRLFSVASTLLITQQWNSDSYYSVLAAVLSGQKSVSVIPGFDEESYTILAVPLKTKFMVLQRLALRGKQITSNSNTYVGSAILCLFLDAGWLNLWDVAHKVP